MAISAWLTKLLSGGIAEILKPISETIDDLVTSKEEKLTLKAQIMEVEALFATKILDYEARLIEARKEIIVAEAQGHSWLQRNWRPILMLTIVAIVFNNYVLFPYINLFFPGKAIMLELPGGLWGLMTTGVGGYVIGRSAERVIPMIKTLKEKEKV